MPSKLNRLARSILSDNKVLSDTKQNEIDAITKNIVQLICLNCKCDRQLNYHSNKNRGFEKHRATPLRVGVALTSYKDNKSKEEIEFPSNIGVTINYDKLERLLTGITTDCVRKAAETGLGFVLPSSFKKGIRPVFAADNIDIGGDRSSFHGADLMADSGKNLVELRLSYLALSSAFLNIFIPSPILKLLPNYSIYL